MTPERIILRHVVAYFKDHAPHLEQNEEYAEAAAKLEEDEQPPKSAEISRKAER